MNTEERLIVKEEILNDEGKISLETDGKCYYIMIKGYSESVIYQYQEHFEKKFDAVNVYNSLKEEAGSVGIQKIIYIFDGVLLQKIT